MRPNQEVQICQVAIWPCTHCVFLKQINNPTVGLNAVWIYLFRKHSVTAQIASWHICTSWLGLTSSLCFNYYFLKIKEKSHKVVSRVARNYLKSCRILTLNQKYIMIVATATELISMLISYYGSKKFSILKFVTF